MPPVGSIAALVLAAGKGTRMKSDLPKVLLPLLEEPVLCYPLLALRSAGVGDVGVVVGHHGEDVADYLREEFPGSAVIWQKQQLGTGHAVKTGQAWWENYEHVLVTPGDVPLLTENAITHLVQAHLEASADCTFLSLFPADPKGYGRVIREEENIRIVEERDATPREREVGEVNSGIYVFRTALLAAVLEDLGCGNSQGEYYLTDVLELIGKRSGRVCAIPWEEPDTLSGVNDPLQLAAAGRVLRDRILCRHLMNGVKALDPATIWIGPRVVLEEDVWLEASIQIWGNSSIGRGSRIGSCCHLCDAILGEDTELEGHVRIRGSRLEKGAKAGPFTYIRDGAVLEEGAFAGRFVEIKKSRIGMGSKVPHLSYMGDATVGRDSNIGAGTITCNYDGEKKNPTIVGDNCFIGSDTMLVAPVRVGDGALTGAGSTITHDVPEGALAVARSKQRNIENWRKRTLSTEQEGGKR